MNGRDFRIQPAGYPRGSGLVQLGDEFGVVGAEQIFDALHSVPVEGLDQGPCSRLHHDQVPCGTGPRLA